MMIPMILLSRFTTERREEVFGWVAIQIAVMMIYWAYGIIGPDETGVWR